MTNVQLINIDSNAEQCKNFPDSCCEVYDCCDCGGDDCGCEERKQKLNEWFPYKKPQCLNEDEYNYLHSYFAETRNEINVSTQQILLKIYNRVFNTNKRPTSCSSCFREVHSELAKVYNTYKEENANT